MIGPRIGTILGPRYGLAFGPGSDPIVPDSAGTSTTLTVALSDSGSPTPAGNNFTYTVQVTNTGGNSATSVSVATTLDASLTYVSSGGTGWSLSQVGQVVTATAAALGTGAANPITITVTAGNANGTATSTVAASASNAPTANDSHNTTVTRPTTSVTMLDATDPIIGGNNEVYTVTFTNSGAGSVNNITATITLDNSLTYVSAVGTGWSIGHAGQTVTATLASLGVASANPITVTATTSSGTAAISSSVAVTCDNAATANASQGTQVYQVSRDATSGIYVPASATEWSNFITAKGLSIASPGSLWLLQEASGNAADTIGAFTLTAVGTVTYQATVSGWSRKGMTWTDNAGSGMLTTNASLPNLSAASQCVLQLALVPSAPSGNRALYEGPGATTVIRVTSTPRIVAIDGANTATGTNSPTGAVRPYVYEFNFTGSAAKVYTDQEKLVPTFAAQSGRQVRLGGNAAADGATVVYACAWYNSSAEISDANMKALLQAMGFSIPWS